MSKKRAKSKSSKSSKNNRNVFIAIGVFVLVLALVVSAAIGSSGFKQRNPKLWFNEWGKSAEANDPANESGADSEQDFVAVDNNGNPIKPGRVYTMPKSLTFVNEITESTGTARTASERATATENNYITLRAKITPENADDQRVTWESSDPEVVSVTVDDPAEPHYATITRERNLYEEITVTCRSVENPEIAATCKIGQLIVGDILELSGSLSTDKSEISFGETYDRHVAFGSSTPGVGTTIGEASEISCTLELTRGFRQELEKQLANLGVTSNPFPFISRTQSQITLRTPYEDYSAENTVNADMFNRAFKLAVKNYTDTQVLIYFRAQYTFQGKEYGYYTSEKREYNFDVSNIWVPVTDIEIGDDVVFQ